MRGRGRGRGVGGRIGCCDVAGGGAAGGCCCGRCWLPAEWQKRKEAGGVTATALADLPARRLAHAGEQLVEGVEVALRCGRSAAEHRDDARLFEEVGVNLTTQELAGGAVQPEAHALSESRGVGVARGAGVAKLHIEERVRGEGRGGRGEVGGGRDEVGERCEVRGAR